MTSKITRAKNAKAFPVGCLPDFVESQLQYECIGGSISYGINQDYSDVDIVGFCIPHKETIFPHLKGDILGFDEAKPFDQFQQHHVKVHDQEFDFTIYGIVKYFALCMDNNPNMLDSLFVPADCVTHITQVGRHVRDNRRLFVSKKCFYKLMGYAHSQINKAEKSKPTGKRVELVEKFGYDTKFASHCIRLMLECEQLLETGEMDLRRDRELLKAIRRGEFTLEDVKKRFADKEAYLTKLYETSNAIPHACDVGKIKGVLLECLEMHFGDLSSCVVNENKAVSYLRQIKELAEKGLS